MATDEMLFDADEQRRQRNAAAADAHLADLVRVYGAPPKRVQPLTYGRLGPSPGSAKFPWRETLATIDHW